MQSAERAHALFIIFAINRIVTTLDAWQKILPNYGTGFQAFLLELHGL